MPVVIRTTSFQELTLHAGGHSDHELPYIHIYIYILVCTRAYPCTEQVGTGWSGTEISVTTHSNLEHKHRNPETQKRRNTETQKHRNTETQKP